MAAPIGLQLYTVREEIASQGMEAVLRKVADIGYSGVEVYSGLDFVQAAKLSKELGLQITSAHLPPPVGDDRGRVLESADVLGINTVVIPWLTPAQYYESAEGVRRAIDLLNESYASLKATGLRLAYHNHDFEFNMVNGQVAYEMLLSELDESILLEVDMYWVKVGGYDPAELVRRLGERAPLLHVKDGPADERDAPMTAAGDGVLDIPGIVAAGSEHTEWLIVELDRCATDMMEAVEKSYRYMVGQGLAQGNKPV